MEQNKDQKSDIVRRSFEREVADHDDDKKGVTKNSDEKRSLMGRPIDPNSLVNDGDFPPPRPGTGGCGRPWAGYTGRTTC